HMKSDKKARSFNLKNSLKFRKVSEVKRTNIFIIEDCPALWELADTCAKLYNGPNFERRQAYMRYRRFEWYPKHSTKNIPRL
ncbi:MAG: hypothetical protein DSO01_08095, partial [Archaeoglobi archaeon]